MTMESLRKSARRAGRRAAAALAFGVAALSLSACATTPVHYDAKAVRFIPPGGTAPWVITGRLDHTQFDTVGDETVTIWIDGDLAALGNFQVSDGTADGSFIGAYRGHKIGVHCTNVAPPGKGFLCDIADGMVPAGTLAFRPKG